MRHPENPIICSLDPTLIWSTQSATALHPVDEFRRQAVQEIQNLVEDMADQTDEWLARLPPHVRRAYTSAKYITQVPVFVHLLRLIQYPRERAHRRLPAHGTSDRAPIGTFVQTRSICNPDHLPSSLTNHKYIQQKLLRPRVDDNYALMLDEIVQEVRAGRMNGPFKHPRAWPTLSVAPCGYDMTDMTLQPLPRQDP